MSLFPLGLLSQGGGGAAGSMELISTASGTGASGTISFTSIPSTYKHLYLRIAARSDYANTYHGLMMTVNGVTSGYYGHRFYGDGGSAYSNQANGAAMQLGFIFGSSATANLHGVLEIDLPDYANTNKNKSLKSLYAVPNNIVGVNSATYTANTAISSIELTNQYGGNFTTTSRFSLYGIAG